MKRELCIWFIVSILLTGLITLLDPAKEVKEKATRLNEKIGSTLVVNMRNANNISFFSVAPIPSSHKGFEIVSEEKEMSPDMCWLLKETLLSDEAYTYKRSKTCQFVPDIGFRFKGNDEVIVLVSFRCRQVKFISGDRAFVLDDEPKHEMIETNFKELLAQVPKE